MLELLGRPCQFDFICYADWDGKIHNLVEYLSVSDKFHQDKAWSLRLRSYRDRIEIGSFPICNLPKVRSLLTSNLSDFHRLNMLVNSFMRLFQYSSNNSLLPHSNGIQKLIINTYTKFCLSVHLSSSLCSDIRRFSRNLVLIFTEPIDYLWLCPILSSTSTSTSDTIYVYRIK